MDDPQNHDARFRQPHVIALINAYAGEPNMVKVQQRGLGKGLSALISENYTNVAPPEAAAAPEKAATGSGAGTIEIAIDRIVPGKFQPRTRFTEEHLRELADSIAKNGIMQPILLRPIKRGNAREIYEIVAGERRWRAATLAGLTSIPALVRTLTDQQALELALIENVQRADLSPLEEANGYQRLMEEFGHTQEELSAIIGKSRSHIANLLRLISMPEDLKIMMDEGTLSMGHARALLNAANPTEIARAVVARGLSVRQTEDLARLSQGETKQPRPRSSSPMRPAGQQSGPRHQADALANKDPDILALEETLTAGLGMAVLINDRGQEGEVMVVYESLKQLDDILRRLSSGNL